jgi:aminoglycoside phosphotransferase (APT) family kinase protein
VTEPIAAGREADVFAIDDQRVLRRYRTGDDATNEAWVMAYVASLGYPVPKVFQAQGPDLVMERLAGPTMAQALVAGDQTIPEAARMLATLLTRLHELPPWPHAEPKAGPDVEPNARPDTEANAKPDAEANAGPDTRPNPGPDDEPGSRVLHLDLHPENIMLTDRGPVVIDWRNATTGPADLDTAFTALILAQVAIGSIAHPMGAGAGDLLDLFLPIAPGDPIRLLDDVVAMRARQSTMSPNEIATLPAAAARARKQQHQPEEHQRGER